MKRRERDNVVGFLVLVALVAAAVVLLAQPAPAHEWYDGACCSDRDCRPVPNGTVRGTPTGYVLLFPGVPPAPSSTSASAAA